MSDLSLQLQQAASQLPVSSYFDEALFQQELKILFGQGPRYVGHQELQFRQRRLVSGGQRGRSSV